MTIRTCFYQALAASVLIGLPAAASAAEIVALGASNTSGRGGSPPMGVSREEAFPAQLERLLQAQGCRVRISNAGVPGDTTGGMLARLAKSLARDTRVVILQPGGNDDSEAETAANVAEIGRRLSARGIAMVTLDQLGRIAGNYRLADGRHFRAEGHAAFAAYLAPQIVSTGICRK